MLYKDDSVKYLISTTAQSKCMNTDKLVFREKFAI